MSETSKRAENERHVLKDKYKLTGAARALPARQRRKKIQACIFCEAKIHEKEKKQEINLLFGQMLVCIVLLFLQLKSWFLLLENQIVILL